jgi:hypothetical protein
MACEKLAWFGGEKGFENWDLSIEVGVPVTSGMLASQCDRMQNEVHGETKILDKVVWRRMSHS